MENNKPKVYFYRLLEIEGSETSDALFQMLYSAFEEDKINNTIQENLAGFASDEASVMIGHRSGLLTKIKNFAKNPVFGVTCMAHRLHLAARKFSMNQHCLHLETSSMTCTSFTGGRQKR